MKPPITVAFFALPLLIGVLRIPDSARIPSSDEISQSSTMAIACRETHFRDYLDGPSVPLPVGLVQPGEVRILRNKRSLRKLIRETHGAIPDRWTERLKTESVLIVGPKEQAFACSNHQIRFKDGREVVSLQPPTALAVASSGGCAILVPRRDVIEISVYWSEP